MTDTTNGVPMTIVDQNQREQPDQHAEQPPASRVDLARTDANRVATLVQIAREGHSEARDSGEDAERLQHASFVLYDRIASKAGDRRTRIDRALHGVDGSLDEEALLEYLDLTGREGFTARKALQRILDRRTTVEFDGGLEISDRLHGLAHAWERDDRVHETSAEVRPALPAAAPAPSVPVSLPRREPGASMRHPIAPSQPPMFPPAPPESPAESTGRLVAVLEDATADGAQQALSGKSIQLLHDNGFGASRKAQAGPEFTPPLDPKFSVAALPQVRAGDTQRLPVLDADGAPRDLVEDGPVVGAAKDSAAPLPFSPAASIAAPASSPSGTSGEGAGDE
jgi:hypothetical protein